MRSPRQAEQLVEQESELRCHRFSCDPVACHDPVLIEDEKLAATASAIAEEKEADVFAKLSAHFSAWRCQGEEGVCVKIAQVARRRQEAGPTFCFVLRSFAAKPAGSES